MSDKEKTVTMSVDQTNPEYSEYLLRCVQLLLNSADEGHLAVVDCYDNDDNVVPVICVMMNDPKAVFPIAQLFRQDQEPANLLTPVATKAEAEKSESPKAE